MAPRTVMMPALPPELAVVAAKHCWPLGRRVAAAWAGGDCKSTARTIKAKDMQLLKAWLIIIACGSPATFAMMAADAPDAANPVLFWSGVIGANGALFYFFIWPLIDDLVWSPLAFFTSWYAFLWRK